jgi:AmmeMemoRadiSam system protein A
VKRGVPRLPLAAAEAEALLALAHAAVRAVALGQPLPTMDRLPDRLEAPQGVFVTVRIAGSLRGCIGVVEASEPLGAAVRHCAVAAASEDPRFAPIGPGDLPGLAVEISVLEEPREVRDPAEIIPGRDGLIVTLGARRGLLLPQVATEHAWEREEFLEQTCRKAGLAPDAWRRGARVETFTAQVLADPQGG